MQALESWRLDFGMIGDHLLSNSALAGAHAGLFWLMPVIFSATAILLWAYVSWRQRRSERTAYAKRNLAMMRRLARKRSAKNLSYARRYEEF